MLPSWRDSGADDAACLSAINDRQRAATSRRCSASGTCAPPSLTDADVLSALSERGTAPHSRREAPEAEQRARALRDGPVVLLDAVGQGLMASVSHRSPQDPADRPPGGWMGIRRDALRRALGHVDQAPQDAPGSRLVPVRAAHGGEEPPLAVDGAIESAPAPGDLHVGLVQVPGAAGVAAPLRAPPIREQRGDATLPGADRLVAALEAALEEPLGDVPDAVRIAEPPAHGAPPAGGRVLAIGARGAGPLVAPPPTGPTAEPPGAERGAPLPLRRGRGCPVGTRQPRPLTIPRMRLAEASEP